jgi:hypothetical protein
MKTTVIKRLLNVIVLLLQMHYRKIETNLFFYLEETILNIFIWLYVSLFFLSERQISLTQLFNFNIYPSPFKYRQQHLTTTSRQKWTIFFFRKMIMWMFRCGWLNICREIHHDEDTYIQIQLCLFMLIPSIQSNGRKYVIFWENKSIISTFPNKHYYHWGVFKQCMIIHVNTQVANWTLMRTVNMNVWVKEWFPLELDIIGRTNQSKLMISSTRKEWGRKTRWCPKSRLIVKYV